MKKLILLMIVIAVVLIVWNRERIYLRDPFASVAREGIKEEGMKVFINYSNDVLLESDGPPMYVTLVQHGQRVGVPLNLGCIHSVACLTDADVATLVLNAGGVLEMSGRRVVFLDGQKKRVVVSLR